MLLKKDYISFYLENGFEFSEDECFDCDIMAVDDIMDFIWHPEKKF